MPFESSLPLVAACLLGAVANFTLWARSQTGWLLLSAVLFICAAIGAFVADTLVMTDREYLQELFPRLAQVAEKLDTATIIAAFDPELRPLREQVEKVLKQVRPTEVVITRIEVAVEPKQSLPKATAEMIVKVKGNVIDNNTPGMVLVGVKVLLHKKGNQWLIKDAELEQPESGLIK